MSVSGQADSSEGNQPGAASKGPGHLSPTQCAPMEDATFMENAGFPWVALQIFQVCISQAIPK